MLNVLRLAWLTTVRQPARSCLGILGVAAVGALLFDMLLLSRGLVLSFRDLLDRAGFDVRVAATDAAPFTGPRLAHAGGLIAAISHLPEVGAAVPLSVRDGQVVGTRQRIQFIGADPDAPPMWTLLEGRELASGAAAGASPVLVNRTLAATLHASPGTRLSIRGECGPERQAVPPLPFVVVGVAEFPYDDAEAETVAGPLAELRRLCGDPANDSVDMLLVRSNPLDGARRAADAIHAARPGLYVVTNEELVQRFSGVEFSYFRQISSVLATVTLFFGFLLIAVLLTASVNERLGEIAALRAVGLSRGRVVAGVLCESILIVGAGAVLAVPLGLALSVWLDRILRTLPGIPESVHFFVFEPRALVAYAWLLAAASVGAALYPMRIVARLPIAATLRREVVG
jgi:putative ABC transport system permease protein